MTVLCSKEWVLFLRKWWGVYWGECWPPAQLTRLSPLPPACHPRLRGQAPHVLGRRAQEVMSSPCPSSALERELPAECNVPPGAAVTLLAGRGDWARPGPFRGCPSPRPHCV